MCDDPKILAFLSFLEQDIEQHPEWLQTMAPDMAKRMDDLTKGMVFDHDEPIDGNVDS